MLHEQMQTPDDELVCSKCAQDSIIETNKGNKVCILLVILTHNCMMNGSENVKIVGFLFDFLMYEMEADSDVGYYSVWQGLLTLFIVG